MGVSNSKDFDNADSINVGVIESTTVSTTTTQLNNTFSTRNEIFVKNDKLKRFTEQELLLSNEQELLYQYPSPIGSITWIQSESKVNNNTATLSDASLHHLSSILKDRLTKISQMNPWLLGRIVVNEDKDKKVYIAYPSDVEYPRDIDLIESIFFKRDDPIDGLYYNDTQSNLVNDDYSNLTTTLTKHGCLLQHKGDLYEPIIKVVIVPCSSKSPTFNKFAIVLSMSHVIADGYTYYTIYNYLMNGGGGKSNGNNDDAAPPPKLLVERQHQFVKLRDETLGKDESFLFSKPGFIASLILGFQYDFILGIWKKLVGVMNSVSKTTTLIMNTTTESNNNKLVENDSNSNINYDFKCYMIDTKQMNQYKKDIIKEDATTNDTDDDKVMYVSSNDVLTSWFLNNTNCTQGFMAINLRNRLGSGGGIDGGNVGETKVIDINDNHAGNYETTLYYRVPDDTSSPTLIRKSLSNLHRVTTYNTKPTFFELATSNFSLITNWSSFTNVETNFDDGGHDADTQQSTWFDLLLHMPVVDITTSNKMPSTLAVGVIFRSRPNELGIMIAGDYEKRIKDIVISAEAGGGVEGATAPFLQA